MLSNVLMNDLGDGTEIILSKSVDDRRNLIEQMNVLVVPRDFKNLEKLSSRSPVKFSIWKCQVLHTGKKTPYSCIVLGLTN